MTDTGRTDLYGPTQDDAARWAAMKDRVRAEELQKLRAVNYGGKSDRIRQAIKRTVLRIPDRGAQEFAFTRCLFYSFEPDLPAFCLPTAPAGCWGICISEMCPDGYIEDAIAHEIAHGFAGMIGDVAQDEAAADTLVHDWGFRCRVEGMPRLLDAIVEWEKRRE